MAVATVYNTLSALDSIAQCRKLDMGGAIRFDPNRAPHDHAVCERCGEDGYKKNQRMRGATVPVKIGGGTESGGEPIEVGDDARENNAQHNEPTGAREKCTLQSERSQAVSERVHVFCRGRLLLFRAGHQQA